MPRSRSLRQTTRTAHNLGFLADADPLFCTAKGSFVGKVEARKRNESHILKSLKILAGVCPDLPLNSVHSSHKLVNYQINPGIRVPRLMGSWMAFCADCQRPVFLSTGVLPNAWKGTDLKLWLLIRAELKPTTRAMASLSLRPYSSRTVSATPTPNIITTPSSAATGTGNISIPHFKASVRPSDTPQSGANTVRPPYSTSPNTVATLAIWPVDGEEPWTIQVHSQADGRVRLCIYKIEVGQIGLDGGAIMAYHRLSKNWTPITHNSPLPVHYRGQFIFMKHEDVIATRSLTEMLLWDDGEGSGFVEIFKNDNEIVEISSDDDEDTYSSPSPMSQKGKGCTF